MINATDGFFVIKMTRDIFVYHFEVNPEIILFFFNLSVYRFIHSHKFTKPSVNAKKTLKD